MLNWTHISAQPSAFRIQVKTPYHVEEAQILTLLHRVAEAAPEVLSDEEAYQPQVLLSFYIKQEQYTPMVMPLRHRIQRKWKKHFMVSVKQVYMDISML